MLPTSIVNFYIDNLCLNNDLHPVFLQLSLVSLISKYASESKMVKDMKFMAEILGNIHPHYGLIILKKVFVAVSLLDKSELEVVL